MTIFFCFFIKAYVFEAIQMSTNNICFYKEADKSTQAVTWTLRTCKTVLS